MIGGWSGAQITESGRKPTFYVPYFAVHDDCENCLELAEPVLSLLHQSDYTRPQFLALYLLEPDHSQHYHGVGSPEAKRAVAQLDRMIGAILDGIEKRGLTDKVNIVIVSDHGQTNVRTDERVYYIEDLIDVNSLIPGSITSPEALWPKPGMGNEIYERLKGVDPHVHVFRSRDIPERWHCCDSTRVPPIVLVTDPGWSLRFRSDKTPTTIGTHRLRQCSARYAFALRRSGAGDQERCTCRTLRECRCVFAIGGVAQGDARSNGRLTPPVVPDSGSSVCNL